MKRKAASDPLLARVLADPDDAGLRAVWADDLLERGDPRGELISLQILAGANPTREQDRRMRSLVAKHRLEWLGPLADVVQHRDGLVFDRGVLAECYLKVKDLPALGNAVGNPLWATVRTIWCFSYAWDARIVPLLVHPVLRELRTLWCIGANNVFVQLARNPRPLPVTAIWTFDDEFNRSAHSIRDVRDAPGLPALRRLGFTVHDPAPWLTKLPIVRRIETLGITGEEPAGTWTKRTIAIENIQELELRRFWIPLQGPLRPHFVLRFTRDARGAWTQLAIEPVRLDARDRSMIEPELDSLSATSLLRITAPAGMHPLLHRFKRAELVASPVA